MNTNNQNSKAINQINEFCKDIEKLYPNIWNEIEEITDVKLDYPWADWCYMPIGGTQAITTKNGYTDINIKYGSYAACMSAWRLTKGIYRFDKELFNQLWEERNIDNIPKELVYQIPQFCMFVECPEPIKIIGGTIVGWFYHLEYDMNTNGHEMRFVFLFEDPSKDPYIFMLHIENTVEESLEKTFDIVRSNMEEWNMFHQMILHYGKEDIIKEMQSVLSITMYICRNYKKIKDGYGNIPSNPYQFGKVSVIPLRETVFYVDNYNNINKNDKSSEYDFYNSLSPYGCMFEMSDECGLVLLLHPHITSYEVEVYKNATIQFNIAVQSGIIFILMQIGKSVIEMPYHIGLSKNFHSFPITDKDVGLEVKLIVTGGTEDSKIRRTFHLDPTTTEILKKEIIRQKQIVDKEGFDIDKYNRDFDKIADLYSIDDLIKMSIKL